jgi:hypothetical protein
MFRTITARRKEDIRKNIKIADLENFEIWAFAPCYKHEIVCEPAYYIDDYTGENIGQELKLVIFPDGTLEPIHHSLFVPELNKVVKLSIEDVSYSKSYYEKYIKK